jgi:hypothetical protein
MMADSDATAPAAPITPRRLAPAAASGAQTSQTVDVAPSTAAVQESASQPGATATSATAATSAIEAMRLPSSTATSGDGSDSDSDSGSDSSAGSDAAAKAESEATGIPLPANTSPSPAANEAAAAQPTASERSAKIKALYWNPPDLDPHKQDRVDASECELNGVLEKAAGRATELVNNLQNFTAQEHIVYRVLGGGAEQIDSGIGDFDYNAILVRHVEGFKVQETRVAEKGSRPFPAASRNIGLPEMALIFLPEFQQNYEMHCGGAALWKGQAAWLVTVRQRKDRPDHTATFGAANGAVFPAPLKGRAWIDQETGEVIHLEIGLMHAILPVGVMGWYLAIDYAPVKFRTRNVEIWLPKFAETYGDSDYRRTIVSHDFSNFLLFSVDTKQEASAPPSK